MYPNQATWQFRATLWSSEWWECKKLWYVRYSQQFKINKRISLMTTKSHLSNFKPQFTQKNFHIVLCFIFIIFCREEIYADNTVLLTFYLVHGLIFKEREMTLSNQQPSQASSLWPCQWRLAPSEKLMLAGSQVWALRGLIPDRVHLVPKRGTSFSLLNLWTTPCVYFKIFLSILCYLLVYDWMSHS